MVAVFIAISGSGGAWEQWGKRATSAETERDGSGDRKFDAMGAAANRIGEILWK
jgi:hypothetical protein